MKQAVSDAALLKATGHAWSYWYERLNDDQADRLSHKEIVARLMNDYGVASWWAQTLAVRYEQTINRRVTGQTSSGDFYANTTIAIAGSIDDALSWWLEKNEGAARHNNQKIVTSSTTQTEKWRYWRAVLADGSKVVVAIHQQTPAVAQLALQHEKLLSPESVLEWRKYWRDFLCHQ